MTDAPIRPTHLVVNLSQLRRNLAAIRARVAPARVLVVLKANAYGHGVDGVAPFIAPYADYIGVAVLEEGIHLRRLGITTPILVMGGVLPEQIPLFLQYDLTLTASSPLLLDAAEQAAAHAGKTLRAHLKIDTGMARLGVQPAEARAFIEQSLRLRHVDVEGIYTHFANAEIPRHADASQPAHFVTVSQQLARFQAVLAHYDQIGAPAPRIRHAANSGAVLNYPEAFFDMVRPGVLFYGVYPGEEVERTVQVAPALTWKSRVVAVRRVPAQAGVSYGSLWRANQDVNIATVPCGYADGYFRRMTNQPRILINGKPYPQVGRICMDQCMVNAGDDPLSVGDEVILLGQAAGGAQVTVEDLAAWAGTNTYEVMTNISARVPRLYVTDPAG